jgi:hypothetical protein
MAVSPNAVEYVLLNAGISLVPGPAAAEPVLLNVGIALSASSPNAVESTLLNALNTFRTNLMKGPSFEDGTKFGWNGTVSAGSTAIDSTQAYSGTKSLKLTSTGGDAYVRGTNGSGLTAEMPAIVPGKVYILSAYIKCSVSQGMFFYYNGANSSGVSTANQASVLYTVSTSWQRYTVMFTAVAGDAFMYPMVRLFGSANGNTLNIDAVTLEESALGDYFDGSSVLPAAYLHAWTGTPNVSTSTESLIPVTVQFKQRESGAWVPHTAVPKVRVAGAWRTVRPKRWNGSAWVDLA